MLEKPTNYEEAKIILKKMPTDDMQQSKLKTAKLRSMFIVGLGAAAAATVGIVSQDPALGVIAFPNAMLLAAPFTLPYFLRKYTLNRIDNGEYFQDKTEDQIIDAAKDYVEQYNKFEERKGGPSK